MANFISLRLARGRKKVPAYAPFGAPEVSAAPRAVTSKEHTAAVARWRGSSRQAKREDNPQSIPTQPWPLYQLGNLIAADLAGAWPGFGGLASELNHLSIAMNISIAESASAALPYGRLIREFLGERARSRREITGPNFPGGFLSVWNPALKLRALAKHPRATAVQKDKPAKADLLKQTKKEADAASKADASAASAKQKGVPRREKQPCRHDRGRDRQYQPRSRSRSRSRRNRSQRKASPKKKTRKKR